METSLKLENIADTHNFSTHLTNGYSFSAIKGLEYFGAATVFDKNAGRAKALPHDYQEHNSVEIVNEVPKGIIAIPDSYFHYFPDFIGPVILFIKECVRYEVNSLHLIFVSPANLTIVKNFYGFLDHCLSKFARNINLSYQVVEMADVKYVKTNNVAVIRQADIGESINTIYKNAIEFAECSPVKPYRKVFLSRKDDKNKSSLQSRAVNEQECEDFFRSAGFEIVSGESFDNLFQQIKFFNEVSVLAALTGSGMTSSMFMQNGQTVLELVTPIRMEDSSARYELHNFYKTISMLKSHKLISVSNINKSSDTIVEDLLQVSKMFQ